MRKLLSLFVVIMAMMFATQAKAQVKFGLRAGADVTNMSISEKVFNTSNRAGFFFGPTVKISLPVIGLGVDASALYDNRTTDVKDENEESQTIRQQQLLIPVNLRYGVGLGSIADVFLFAGPQWGINVGDQSFVWDKGSSYSLKKSNFSVNIGAGVTLLAHLQLTANYNVACGSSADLTVVDAVDKTAKNFKSHNNTWQIGLAYLF
jgi:hypothetical protein